VSHTLARGDRVGVVAPGFAVEPESLERGLARLRDWGYRPEPGARLLARAGYLAGSDDERLADLTAMAVDPGIKAIWFARGGYGTARLLERVPWKALSRKLLVGYSDLTALFAAGAARGRLRALYGPGVCDLAESRNFHAPSLRRLLAGKPLELRVAQRNVLVPGRASGRLAGGNLAVLTHLCGTPWMPRLRGAVIFIEEVGEGTYRIDRMLTQLAQARALAGLAGVLIGSLIVPPRSRFPPDRRLVDVLRERFEPLGVPVVRGLVAGHCAGKRTLPLGETVRIDTAAGRILFPR
jgi:muramoyltetrapeptide carboxypeptidase